MLAYQEQTTARSIERQNPREHVNTKVKSKRSLWNRASLIGCAVVSFTAVWMVAQKGAQVYQINDANVQLQSQIQTMDAKNASLVSQEDELKNPAYILAAAHKDGMVPGNPIQIGGTTSTGK